MPRIKINTLRTIQLDEAGIQFLLDLDPPEFVEIEDKDTELSPILDNLFGIWKQLLAVPTDGPLRIDSSGDSDDHYIEEKQIGSLLFSISSYFDYLSRRHLKRYLTENKRVHPNALTSKSIKSLIQNDDQLEGATFENPRYKYRLFTIRYLQTIAVFYFVGLFRQGPLMPEFSRDMQEFAHESLTELFRAFHCIHEQPYKSGSSGDSNRN